MPTPFERSKQFRDNQMDPDNYYRMPPTGITQSRVKVDGIVRTMFTIRCGASDCWYVGNAGREQDVNQLLLNHECPTAPIRNELPTGYSTLDKMWDELDAATAALLEAREWKTGTMTLSGTQLQYYCRGIAFGLSMLTHPHFRTVQDVSIEALRRYKQYKGEVEKAPTPGYRGHNPMPASSQRMAGDPSRVSNKPAPVAPNPMKRAPLAAAKKSVSQVDLRSIDAETANKIKAVDAAGVMPREQLARMYGLTVDTVKAICGG